MAGPTKKPSKGISRGSGDRMDNRRGKGHEVVSAAFSSPPNFKPGHKGKNTGRAWN